MKQKQTLVLVAAIVLVLIIAMGVQFNRNKKGAQAGQEETADVYVEAGNRADEALDDVKEGMRATGEAEDEDAIMMENRLVQEQYGLYPGEYEVKKPVTIVKALDTKEKIGTLETGQVANIVNLSESDGDEVFGQLDDENGGWVLIQTQETKNLQAK
ncbi:hypothetical protein [uncultured Dubosiella sp.]|nr:hypothetical protein [uncultured Dubosiella sp.]